MVSSFQVDSQALPRLSLHMVVRLFQRLSWNTRPPPLYPTVNPPRGENAFPCDVSIIISGGQLFNREIRKCQDTEV